MVEIAFQFATIGLGVGMLIGLTFGFTGWLLSLSFKLLNKFSH